MSFRYNWKNINGHMLMLILLAPIVYLFGTQFVALAGAHGEQILNYEEVTEVDRLVHYDGDTYYRWSYLANPWSFSYVVESPLDFYSSPENVEFVSSEGNLMFQSTNLSNVMNDFDYFGSSIQYIVDHLSFYFSEPEVQTVPYTKNCVSFWVKLNQSNKALYFAFLFHGNEYYEGDVYDFSVSAGGLICNGHEYVFADSGYSVYVGASISISQLCPFTYDSINMDGYDDVTIPFEQPTITYSVATSDTSYSSALFGRWFGANNILEKMGRNALSSTPMGFAPFGSFLSFIDVNMLHMADSQIGLMAYGYFYYASNVLIFDLAFYCVTFLPRIIRKVVEKFEGGLD